MFSRFRYKHLMSDDASKESVAQEGAFSMEERLVESECKSLNTSTFRSTVDLLEFCLSSAERLILPSRHTRWQGPHCARSATKRPGLVVGIMGICIS